MLTADEPRAFDCAESQPDRGRVARRPLRGACVGFGSGPVGALIAVVTLVCGLATAPGWAQPNIASALGPGVPSPSGLIGSGTDLWRFDLDTSAYPQAVCNDLTGARIYLRQGSGDDVDRWQIHLQGGGGCRSGDSCADRWKNVETNFGAHKMSTDWAPNQGIVGQGILAPHAENKFADWNHVYVYYCSSDTWSGRGTTSTSVTLSDGTVIPYSIDFHGADIIDAVIDTLRRGNGPVSYLEGGETPVLLPDLDDATDVLLTGSSAGGGGVIRNADRVFETLRTFNNACLPRGSCDLRLAAVPEATFGPDREQLDWSTSQSCVNAGLCTYQDLITSAFDVLTVFWHWAGEASCFGFHAAGGDTWRCADTEHLVQNHLQAPFFVRMDTQDSLLLNNLLDQAPGYKGAPVGAADFGQLVHDQLLAFENLAATSEEARVAGPLEPPGAFGAQCQDHVTISNQAHYDRLVARESDGELVDSNDLLWDWFWASGEREAIQPFVMPGRDGVCGAGIFADGFESGDTQRWSDAVP